MALTRALTKAKTLAGARRRRSYKHAAFSVAFGRVGYALAWTGVYALHCVCAAYFIAAGMFYRAFPTTIAGATLELYSLTLKRSTFYGLAIVHFALAAMHAAVIALAPARILVKRVATNPLSRRVQSRVASMVPTGSASAQFMRVSRLRIPRTVNLAYRRVYAAWFTRSGFFGVEGKYFEAIFLSREMIETALQSNQAYQMSRLLPRMALNRFYVGVLIVNCWSTPLVYYFVRRNKPMQRLLCMLSDIVLDFISSIGVPVVLALSYINDYNPESTDFPISLWYNDAWLVNVINELPIILFGSWLDAFGRLVFSISLLSCMEDVKNLIQRDKCSSNAVHTEPACQPSVQTIQDAYDQVAPAAGNVTIKQARKDPRERLIQLAHFVMAAYGVVVLGVQLHTETKSTPQACVLEVRPWLVSQPACALVEINCHTNPSLTGSASDFDAIFGDLDAESLEHIVYRHCPQIEFTTRFHAFRTLFGLKTYNSTIVAWPESVALTNTHHPRMRFAYFVLTQFPNAALPDGLAAQDFPQSLLDVEISSSNIRSVPPYLHERWPKGVTLLMESAQFTEYPVTFSKMALRTLALTSNHIAHVPAEALMSPGALQLSLSGNNITYLPEDGVDSSAMTIYRLFVDSTNLSAAPAWMDEAYLSRAAVYAGATPLCKDVILNEGNTSSARAILEARPWLTMIDCTDFEGNIAFYPFDVEVRDDEVW